MTPIPYRSAWAALTHYLVRALVRGAIVYAVVPNGTQPADGLTFPNRRDATAWLRDNGFAPV